MYDSLRTETACGASPMGEGEVLVNRLMGEPIEGLSNGELAQSLVDLENLLDRLEAERNRRLSLFSQRHGYFELEYPSASSSLIHRCRMAPQRAIRLVAQASALQSMALTREAWTRGEVTSDQVRCLLPARQLNPTAFAQHEATLVDAIAGLSVAATRQAVAYWRQAVDHRQAETSVEELLERRRIHLSETFEGMWRIDGWLDPLAGEILNTALQAATPPPAAGDARTPAQRRADGLTDLARLALDQGQLPQQGGEKPHLLVLVDASRLQPQAGQSPAVGRAETAEGTVFTQSTVDLLSCDCSISRIVFGARSEVVDLGRKTRLIPPALRRAVIARDRHCQHAGCYRPAKWCDIDHIIPWQHGGETKLENLQLLCRYHHRLKHINQTRTTKPLPRCPSVTLRSQTLIPLRT